MIELRNPFRRPEPAQAAPEAATVPLRSATHVTIDELIALQRKVGDVELNFTGHARATLAGQHGSRFRGRGMDYEQSRIYQPGDDIRSMDWRVTARTGKPHTKLYREERERPVIVFVDLHPGMFFGTRGMLKSVAAARAAALIGWAAVAHGDRIGAMLCNGSHLELQPRGGRHGVLRLIRALIERTDPRDSLPETARDGALNAALVRLRRVSRPGSLVLLISDFYGIDEETSSHLLRLRQHSDVAAIQVVDPLELAPPLPARYGVADGTRVGVLDVRSSKARQAYAAFFSRHHAAVADLMRKRAIPLCRLSTEDDVGTQLRSLSASRSAEWVATQRAA